jgi:hypothetical protein
MGTTTDVVPSGIVAVGGSVTTAVLSELRFTVRPPGGAGYCETRVSLSCLNVVIVTVEGAQLSVSITSTGIVEPAVSVPPETVMLEAPSFSPHN